jgi:hypothetical protein
MFPSSIFVIICMMNGLVEGMRKLFYNETRYYISTDYEKCWEPNDSCPSV